MLAGHSLGAYVALLAATRHPDRFGGLLLVDGGLPLPVPDGADLDAVLDASLGPALARLRETFPSVTAYFDFWRAHPGPQGRLERRYRGLPALRPDRPRAGALKSRVVEEAARTDGRELLGGTATFGAALGALPWPARLLTAPAGLFGEPPGMQPPELCATWLPQAPLLLAEEVPGCNHYTLVLDPAHAATVAARITQTAAA